MGGDDLDDLLLGDAEARLEVSGGGQVAALPVAARERLVGDAADEVLEEAVLAALGGARVGLDAEHLLANETRRSGSSSASESPESAATDAFVNVLPSTEASCSRRRSSGASPSRRAAIRPCSVSGTSSCVDLAGDAVDALLLDEQAAVEQHADRLDRVQRNALGPGEDALAKLLR